MSKLTTTTHPLFTKEIVDLLHSKNIKTTLHFLESETKKISCITNIPHKDVLVIRNHIINKSSAVTRNSLNYLRELIEKSAIIATGIKNLDTLLEGGFATGKIYEVCGYPSSGKTQLCLTICKNISQNLQQNVYYLDTKLDFRARRIKEMLGNISKINLGEILSRILVKQVNSKFELINSLYKIKEDILSGMNLKLLIIDSLPPLFTKSDQYNVENNIHLNHVVNIMHFLTKECHIAIVIVNLISSWSDGDFKRQNLQDIISCGKYWRSVPHVRLRLDLNNGFCQISTSDSHSHSSGATCVVAINENGVV